MTDRPWYQWYPQDIRGEKTYRLCSPMARLLWRECLDLMHDAPQRGYLVDDQGKPLTPREVATLTALPLVAVTKALEELRTRNVCGWDEERGVMFSRRMVRDTERQRRNADNGRHGGNPKLTKSDNRASQTSDKPSDKANARTRDRVPESRDQKPDPETRESEERAPHRQTLVGSTKKCAAFVAGFSVPYQLHEKLMGLCRGMSDGDADAEVRAFYAKVEADPRWAKGPIGDSDVYRFIDARWKEAHGGSPARKPTLDEQNVAAWAEVDRQARR